MVQNPFCTNIVMLHTKSKVMKSRIQWCKNFAPGACLGVTRGKKIGFWVRYFFIVTHLLLGFLSLNLETVTGNSPMDEDWRNTFGILMCTERCDGAGAGICDGGVINLL